MQSRNLNISFELTRDKTYPMPIRITIIIFISVIFEPPWQACLAMAFLEIHPEHAI